MVDLHKQDGCIRNDIDKAIADAVDECAFIKGAEVGTFEAELAHYVNAKYCISCGNGTDAITLALMAVGRRSDCSRILVCGCGGSRGAAWRQARVCRYRSAYFQH